MQGSIGGRYLQCVAPLPDCTPSRAFMRWSQADRGQRPGFPPTHSLTALSLEDQHDLQAAASHPALLQRAPIPALSVRQGFAVRVFAAVQWKADATWLSQIA